MNDGWHILPLEAWPQRDRAAWEAARHPGGPLEPGGPAARLRPETLRLMQRLHGQFLHWLRERGDLDEKAGPAERMTHERFVVFVAERRTSVSANTLFNQLRMMAMMLTMLTPGTEWGWLYRHHLAPRRHEAAASRRPVSLVQPGPLLFTLKASINKALQEPETLNTAIRLRDLLMFAVTMATALRLRNVLALTVGQSLLRQEYGYEIRFPPNTVKNARAISMTLMPELTGSLDQYMEFCRPLLLARHKNDGGALWVSKDGRRLAVKSAQAAFERVTLSILGHKVNPHALRHSAATAILSNDMLATGLASAVLAHHDLTTVERFYDLSSDRDAQVLLRERFRMYREKR